MWKRTITSRHFKLCLSIDNEEEQWLGPVSRIWRRGLTQWLRTRFVFCAGAGAAWRRWAGALRRRSGRSRRPGTTAPPSCTPGSATSWRASLSGGRVYPAPLKQTGNLVSLQLLMDVKTFFFWNDDREVCYLDRNGQDANHILVDTTEDRRQVTMFTTVGNHCTCLHLSGHITPASQQMKLQAIVYK